MSAAVAVAERVQTSAQEPDLFAGEAAPITAPALEQPEFGLDFTGRLADKPHVALEPCDRSGHFRPVVVLKLHEVGPSKQRLCAHVVFTNETRAAADALAASLHIGDIRTVRCPLSALRLFLDAATLITPTEDH